MRLKAALIGSYPPPFGGIEVHIKRLAGILEENGIEVTIYDIENISESNDRRLKKIAKARLWTMWHLFTISEDIIHVHTLSWKHRAAMAFISKVRRKKTVMSFHSFRDEYEDMSFVEAALVRYVFKNADVIIAVSESVGKKLEDWGCSKDKIRCISGFLPPGAIEQDLPVYVREFISSHDIIASANGSNMNFYKGQDLYGLDMLVELCGRISGKHDVGFIYCISKGYINSQDYYEHIKGIIREKGIEDKFLFVHENIEFASILKNSDFFIRPTNTDGYSLSVAEAVYGGVPSIASDVSKRPPGSILFKTRDIGDLYEKTIDVIENMEKHKKSIENAPKEENGELMIQVYMDLLAKEGGRG